MFSLKFDEIQEQVRDTAAKFAREEIAPSVIERDTESKFPKEILEKLGELGFLGMMTSADYGGSELDAISYVLAITEIAKVDAGVTIILSVQNSLCNWIIETYGTEEQKQKYLVPLAEGTKLGAYCLSEPEAGSDARGLKTFAEVRRQQDS